MPYGPRLWVATPVTTAQRDTQKNSLRQNTKRGSLVVSVDGSAHAFDNDQVCAHSGICEGVWHPSEVQAGAALAIACHIQARFPAGQCDSESGLAERFLQNENCLSRAGYSRLVFEAEASHQSSADAVQWPPFTGTILCLAGYVSLLQAAAMQVSS